jgi:large subunit ribosomal protein L6
MSRIGKQPVDIPAGVTVELADSIIRVKGPKGSLERKLPPSVAIKVEGAVATVERADESRASSSMHGLARTLLANMVTGVVEPFKKSLEIQGIGYRAELKGDKLNLQVGLSHEVNHPIPSTVTCQVDKMTMVHLTSPDKELVGRVAAEIRAYRPCEPYKGKGIKYVGERIRRKEGKTGT